MNTHIDGVLFGDLFGTGEMREIFSERGFLDRFLRAEAALARSEARAGIVPDTAAEKLTRKASVDYLDMAALEENISDAEIFTVGIIETWADELGDESRYVHWGATSHDMADTAFVLQIRDGLAIVDEYLRAIRDELKEFAATHRETPMPGRTQYVHGPPITFGLKAAQKAAEVERHLERVDEVASRLSVVELFGSTGTLAATEDEGLDILAAFADELGLDAPDAPWISSRDRFAELLSLLAGIGGTLEGLSRNVLFMNRPEVGELDVTPAEASGSSTNPHKQNPVRPQYNVALARLLRGHAHAMGEATAVLGQRDRSSWHVEFAVVPEGFLYLGRILANTRSMLEDITVQPDAMERNIERAGELPVSEAVMIALAEYVGRQEAHEIVSANAERAHEEDGSFSEHLKADDRVTEHLPPERIDELTEPANYTGLAADLADRVR